MGGEINTNLDDLQRLSSTLRDGAARLDGPSGSAPDAPDAGESKPLIAAKLLEVSGAVIALHADLGDMADAIVASRGQYHETDAENAGNLKPR